MPENAKIIGISLSYFKAMVSFNDVFEFDIQLNVYKYIAVSIILFSVIYDFQLIVCEIKVKPHTFKLTVLDI